MKRSQAIALTALTTTLAAGFTLYWLARRKHAKRKAIVSNAGYEMAYDIHYPVKYRRQNAPNDAPNDHQTEF